MKRLDSIEIKIELIPAHVLKEPGSDREFNVPDFIRVTFENPGDPLPFIGVGLDIVEALLDLDGVMKANGIIADVFMFPAVNN